MWNQIYTTHYIKLSPPLDASGAVLYRHPYQLCILPHFISSSNKDYLQQLTDELLRLKFVEKNNDLYQFRQVRLHFSLNKVYMFDQM